MALVSVKNKYQVLIPRKIRQRIGINVGDLLEVGVERGKITFTPKSIVDRGVEESLADFKQGRAYGPFATHAELIASLHTETAKPPARKKLRTRRT